MTLSGLKCVE